MPDEPVKAQPLAIRGNAAITFPVIFEDAYLLIIDKPYGLVVQPGKGHTIDTLLNGLFAMRDGSYGKLLHNLGVRRDYGLLHRLDKETSGLLVVAKMPNAYDELRRAFEARNVEKEYLALVAGVPSPRQGVVQARLKEIIEPGTGMKKVMISRQGQEAISAYRVLAHTGETALVRVRIKTGRLHQIRAHMLYLNTPVLGDDLYQLGTLHPTSGTSASKGRGGGGGGRAPRLCLHAAHLGFKHPISGKFVHFESPLPPDLANFARKLKLPSTTKDGEGGGAAD